MCLEWVRLSARMSPVVCWLLTQSKQLSARFALQASVYLESSGRAMDKSEDLELEESSKLEGKSKLDGNSKLEENSKLEGKPGGKEDFDKLLTELGGFGKYQKRLLCLLTPFLFMTIPLLQNHQVLRVGF